MVSMTGMIAKRADKISPHIFDKLLEEVRDRGLHALSKQSGTEDMASTGQPQSVQKNQKAPQTTETVEKPMVVRKKYND